MTKNPNTQRNPKTEDRKSLFGVGCFGPLAFNWRPLCRHLLAGLRYYRRSHVGVLLGSVLASAVLTGSLLVGDSVDGTLRKTALQRLGKIEYAVYTPDRFFAANLAGKNGAVPVLQLRGIAITDEQQINQVQVLGVSSNVWKFCDANFQTLENEVLLGRKLATALDVEVGDEISLRIEKPGLLPRDAPLSEQGVDRTVRARLTVAQVLSDDELGRFSLSANQQAPYNAFVNQRWLAARVGRAGKANLMVSRCPILLEVWDGADFGFCFRQEGDVTQLESDQVYLDPEAVRAALRIPGAQGTLTYLVNALSKDGRATPYSFVLADDRHQLAGDEIILNRWLADELNAVVGDAVRMKYFELLPGGGFAEKSRTFRVRSIIEMDELATEKELAPQFPGLSDVDRCADWDVGIPMDETQLEDEANEAYWEEYGQTPKAIVSLKAGQDMWSNRFGSLTSVRWETSTSSFDIPCSKFCGSYDPAAAGYISLPVQEQALAAVNQAMDFGQLFIGMSFFLIVAALILTALLFAFGIQRRTEEAGILLAVGWRPREVRRLFMAEGGAVALAGSIAGAVIGIGYTGLLLAGLSSLWKGAVAGSAIELFVSAQTVITGAVASFLCAMLAMFIAIRRQTKLPARELLAADLQRSEKSVPRRSRFQPLEKMLPMVGIIISGAIVAYALMAHLHSVTMPFFGAGALLLVSGILFCGAALRRLGSQECLPHIRAFALRNMARRRGRSLAVIGLLACGCFLVFAVAAMKEDLAAHADEHWSGTGGFKWFGESTLPITDDLGGVRIRVRDGDEAGCLNLNRAQSPRILGVNPDALSDRNAFFEDEDIWQLLKQDLPGGAVPALAGDADTMMWGLEKKPGDRMTVRDGNGREFEIELVGSLPMRLSVFQGSLLIAEEQFAERFPSEEGWRMFLWSDKCRVSGVEGEEGEPKFQVSSFKFSRKYERAGLVVVPSVERLLEFYSVESTYLAMFLVLGALGLAVGSMGMGVVVLRNVQDRQAELAVLRAVGYRNGTLRNVLFIEHGLLLAAGLGVGVLSAAVAMVPALAFSQSRMPVGFMSVLFLAVIGLGALCAFVAVTVSMRRAQGLPGSSD